MTSAEEVASRALAMVAASRALRERQERERRDVYEKVQISMLRQPKLPKGLQLRLKLQ